MDPILTLSKGLYAHNLWVSKGATSTPLGTKIDPLILAITSKGLYIPSKISFKIPGPSYTDKGDLVLITGSPTVKPAVSS